MKFSRLLGPILLVGSLVFLAASCGDGQGPATPDGDGLAAEKTDPFELTQEVLEWIYEQDVQSTVVYEVAVSGRISLADGGTIEGAPASWPQGYGFRYTVLPGSIDPASLADPGADSVTITLKVPVLDTVFPSDDDFDGVMPMILEPDGLRYLIPPDAQTEEEALALSAECWFSFHPALEPSCWGYVILSADLEVSSGDYYTEEKYDFYYRPAAPVFDKYKPVEKPYRDCFSGIYSRIQHHSRWAVVKGDGGSNPV